MMKKVMTVLMVFLAVTAFGKNFDTNEFVAPKEIEGECIPPTQYLQDTLGITCIELSDISDMDATITGYNAQGQAVCQVLWQCVDPQVHVTFTDGANMVRYIGEQGVEDTLINYNGAYMDINSVPDSGRALIQNGGELFAAVVADNACPTEALSEGGRRAANTICYVAGIATGFWPIGTLIAGPTALGCVVMYATGAL